MVRYFYVKLDSGTSQGPYDIYYDVVGPGNIATLYKSNLPAQNLSWTSLTSDLGVPIIIPGSSSSVIILNKVASLNLQQVILLPTNTPTPTPTQTPTNTITRKV